MCLRDCAYVCLSGVSVTESFLGEIEFVGRVDGGVECVRAQR